MKSPNAIDIEDFLAIKSVSGLRYSPDGARIAFVVQQPDLAANAYRSRLWVWERQTGACRELEADLKSGILLWLVADIILFSTTPAGDCKARVEAGETWTSFATIDTATGAIAPRFDVPLAIKKIARTDYGAFVVLAVHVPADSGALTAHSLKAGKDYEVIDRLPIWSDGPGFLRGQVNRLYYFKEGQAPVPLTDEATNVEFFRLRGGELLYAAKRAADFMKSAGLFLRDLGAGTTKRLIAQDRFAVVHADFLDGGIVFVGVDRNGGLRTDNPKFYMLDGGSEQSVITAPNLGAGEPRLLADPDLSVRDTVGYDCRYGESTAFKVHGGALYCVTTHERSSFLTRVGTDGKLAFLTGDRGSVQDFDLFGGEAVFAGLLGMGLQELYMLDTAGIRTLTRFNAEVLGGKPVSPAEPMVFENHGGPVHYVVLKPANFDPALKYPAVLYIHGGAKVLYGPVFFHEMQVLAGRGFFVIYGNPRGSDGQGSVFARLRGNYGKPDYEDMMRAMDTAIERYPQIDKSRLAVAGGSYGGIMTNWIVGHTDRFKCAISQRSLCNMISAFGTADNGYDFVREQMAADPWSNLELLWEQSPLKYANKVRTPLLLVHSEEDRRCHYSEAIQFFTALRSFGVEARMIFIRGETHELSRSGRPRQRILRLTEIVAWLEKYLDDPKEGGER